MNIVFFYESLALGGQQTQTYQLVRRLAERGHRMSWVYLYGGGLEAQVAEHARIRRIARPFGKKDYLLRPWRILRAAYELSTWMRAERADVVVSGSGIGSLVAGLASRRTGARVSREKFIEVDNAVDTDMFVPLPEEEREEVRRSLGIEADELVIGWIGRVAENMQVGNTVDLCAELRRRGFDRFRLLAVGGGPWMDALRSKIDRLGLTRHSLLTDWVPMEQVNRYVNAMDIVPLLEEDPQGGSIVREAMACGRIALSVDGASGTQRRFMPPGAAVLVSPEQFISAAADAVLALAADLPGRSSIGENARRYAVQHMSFDTQAATLLRAFER